MNLAIDLQIILENTAVEILNTVNWMKGMHNEHLPLNFISMKFTYTLTENGWAVLSFHLIVYIFVFFFTSLFAVMVSKWEMSCDTDTADYFWLIVWIAVSCWKLLY